MLDAEAALAQGSDTSVDSMFQDNEAKPKADATEPSKEDENKAAARHGLARLRPRRVVANPPLVTLDAFAKSALSQGSGWPGLGPFKLGPDGVSLVDEAQNVIRVKTQDQKITGAELQLAGKPRQDFLGTEMGADFLLEALNTRPARINQFNAALEKSRPSIFGKARNEAHIDAGRYIVYVRPGEANAVTVRVENTEANTQEAGPPGQHSGGSTEPNWSDLKGIFDPVRPKKGDYETGPAHQPETSTANTALSPADAQKQTFKQVIEKWQAIKRNAVKNRDISRLPEILAGKSLPQQTRGVKWLADHHYYYDMSPRGIEVGSVMEIEKGRKYAVIATVKEYSKMYEETTNKLLKDSEDCYTVNYTVEKQGDKYLIVDSQIIELKPSAPPKKL